MENAHDVLKICTSAVKVLGKKQRKVELEGIQEKMKHAHIVPDTAFYNALFMSYADKGHASEIFEGLLQMEAAGVKPDYLTYEALTIAHLQGEAPELNKATGILKDTIKQGLLVKAIIFRKLISAYWEAENVEGAEEIFTLMQNAGYLPDLKVIAKLMQLHGRQGNVKRNIELFKLLQKSGIKQTNTAYTFLLHAYCKAGLTKKACETFERFEKVTGCRPSLVAFNMIMYACGRQGMHKEALEYYGKVCNAGMEMNVVSYCSVISAMVKSGRFKKAEQLFNRMLKKDIQPNLHIYLTMIHCYTNIKATKLGHELYSALKKSNLMMTETAYSTILALYVEGRWYHHAAKILKHQEKAGFNLDTAAQGLLVRAFGEMDDDMVPLAEGVKASQFDVCKLLVSLSLIKKGNVKIDFTHQNLIAGFLDSFKDGHKDASATMYNALLDCFWQRGLRRNAQVLLEKAREVCAPNTRPQLHNKEWILDVRKLSIGGSKVAVADWLNHVDKLNTKDVVDDRQMVIMTGVGKYLPHVLESEDVKTQIKGIKGALLETLQGLESPFVESPENPAKLQASAMEVSGWILGGGLKQDLSLVDCC